EDRHWIHVSCDFRNVFETHGGEEMILKIFSDAAHVCNDTDTVCAKLVRRADAGEEKHLRRSDRARTQNDLSLRARDVLAIADDVLHADGASIFHDEARDERVGLDGEIRARAHGLEESD